MGKRILMTVSAALMLSFSAAAQPAVPVHGKYRYVSDGNVTVEQAKLTALERAKIEAIAEKFGTLVEQSNATFVKNSAENSETASVSGLLSLGSSEVRGEWIETIGTPRFDVSYENGMLVVTAEVRGRAREIKGAKVDFTARLLRGCTDPGCESAEFIDGNSFYLRFSSPVSGFLAVYLVDEGMTAYCLLPDRYAEDGAFRIRAGREYTLFSAAHAENGVSVEEYVFTAGKEVEFNALYILFSPNGFTKADDSFTSELMPRELSFADFSRWLAGVRRHDADLRMKKKIVTIRQN
ncbi:MAG: DUF4384 domain-containing protein [bacterium]|uniref:DUF4384 domain-containing protein n=1 Tax=Candidatus Aphodosoma intestinipullorum TaxID=2840674 RepID=A0A940DJ18_9BACT|nr:DUF4384 domain-containing protein [Candidatus Aphodosoma intestinipullorum]